jgi:hypothetical protein
MVTRGALASVQHLKSEEGRLLRAQHQERAQTLKVRVRSALPCALVAGAHRAEDRLLLTRTEDEMNRNVGESQSLLRF